MQSETVFFDPISSYDSSLWLVSKRKSIKFPSLFDEVIPILSLGGKGVISVLSNVMPKYVHDMTYNFFNGNVEEATKMQLDSLDLIDALFCEVNPIPVKYALNLMGYEFGVPRLPLVELSDSNKEKMKTLLRKYDLI